MSALEEIKARVEKATPGPWGWDGMDSGHSKYEMSWWVTAGEGDAVCDMNGLARAGNEAFAKDDGGADAEFIAHARTDIPKLIAALEAVEALHVPIFVQGDPAGCRACDWETDDGWPCQTLRAINEALEETE